MEEQVYHKPIMLNEAIEALDIKPDGIYIDATFGGGGHSKEILKHLTTGRLISFDVDNDAEKNIINDEKFTFVKSNFKYIPNFLKYFEIDKVDGILADLGVSSHHFDFAERGFSYRFEGPLDMRMNQEAEFSAQNIVNEYKIEDLYKIFKYYGEINNTKCLVDNIIAKREISKILTITDFIQTIEPCTPKNQEYKYLSKVFQALRIETNKELDVLQEFLLNSDKIVKQNGILVIITFHSLEDRLVKNYFKSGNFEGKIEKDLYGNILSSWKPESGKLIIPSDEEIAENNRARSAKLRVGIKS